MTKGVSSCAVGQTMMVLALGACNPHPLEAPTVALTATNTNVFPETTRRKLDILFMIDNSSSMDTAQANLKRNFPVFMNILKGLAGGLPDLHIAVVTSDMGAGDGIAGCRGHGDNGVFRSKPGIGCTATNLQVGAAFIVDTGGANPQTNFTGDITAVFQCLATVGSDGCGFEHQLASVARALGADGLGGPPQENQGFLRPDAQLAIILVTNEDDCSAPSDSPIYGLSTELNSRYGPTQNFVCNEWGHLCSRDGGPLVKPSRFAPNNRAADTVTYSPAGGPDRCVSAEGEGLLTPVGSGGYADGIKALKKAASGQILVAAIAGPTTPYAVDWRDAPIADAGPWPEVAHSCGAESDPTGFADPAVRLQQFVKAFGGHGLVLPFCSTDYSPALATIAATLVGPANPKCIEGPIATRPGSTTPDCAVTDVVTNGGTATTTVVPACADTRGAPPCWTLTAPTTGQPCPVGSRVVTVDRGGLATADDLEETVQCATCPSGAASEPSQGCLP